MITTIELKSLRNFRKEAGCGVCVSVCVCVCLCVCGGVEGGKKSGYVICIPQCSVSWFTQV